MITKLLAALVLATASVPSTMLPEDCTLTGPYCYDDGQIMVLDNGSSGNTKNPGCDGCIVHFDVDVTWLNFGTGTSVDPNGNTSTFAVTPFWSANFSGTYSVGCDTPVEWDFFWDTGAASGGGMVKARCEACR